MFVLKTPAIRPGNARALCLSELYLRYGKGSASPTLLSDTFSGRADLSTNDSANLVTTHPLLDCTTTYGSTKVVSPTIA